MSSNESPSEAFAGQGLPYSVKLEQTAKGVRVTVHVYGRTFEETRDGAVRLYTGTVIELESKQIPVAPMIEGGK